MTTTAARIKPLVFDAPKVPIVTTNAVQVDTIRTVDDVLLNRKRTSPTAPLISYPVTPRGKTDYKDYSAEDLNRFVDEAIRLYASSGLFPENVLSTEAETVAILAPSNLDYVVSIFALSRMSFSVLFLSNRLSTEAYVSLLQKTRCVKMVCGAGNRKAAELIRTQYPLSLFDLVEKHVYDIPVPSGPPLLMPQLHNVLDRIAFIVHSSGSTGLPKPILQTHKACLSNYSSGIGYKAFLTLPLYHNHGISTLFRAIFAGKKIAMMNANLPLSAGNLVDAMESVEPESFHGVPYALKLLSETERGVQALRKCKLVLYGGSSCPDEVGDELVRQGVYVVGHYGATEMGQLMTSFRTPEDKAWNYMRPLFSAKPYIRMIECSPNVYECIVLDGLPSKVLSNSSDPPNSYHTSDTFSPHPTIPDAWKYLGRLDDRITLINGEKVLPIPYEHHIRQNELVSEVVLFGVGRAMPGMFIVPSERAKQLHSSELLETLMPLVEATNSRTETFGRISREMIEILDIDVEYPRTDKGTVIRAAFYKQFTDRIDQLYSRFEIPTNGGSRNLFTLNLEGLELYLLNLFKDKIQVPGIDRSTDFFDLGIDSLQAITARGYIMREIDLGSKTLKQNVVFEHPNIERLARHLYSIRTGDVLEDRSELQVMAELVQKYSVFPERSPGLSTPDGETIILTGATGSLGAHILAQVVKNPQVKMVYCFVRASDRTSAEKRVQSSLSSRNLTNFTTEESGKIQCLPVDLSKTDFSLDSSTFKDIMGSLTVVIHAAWAVNFNLGVRSFESHHINGTYNLLNACLQTSTVDPARLYFCSSISAAAGTPLPATIAETYIEDFSHAQGMGYAQSKLVTEHVIKAAAEKTGMCARVLRVGQIVGDTEFGMWNTTEAIPLMLQSAATIGALPALQETPSWMPVDKVARAVLELSHLTTNNSTNHNIQHSDTKTVYHIQNCQTFHWTQDLLPALRSAGLTFKTVSQRQWVKMLREGEQDPTKNPTIKLLDFFAEKYDNEKPGREGLEFAMERSKEDSEAIREGFDVLGSGLMKKTVIGWGLGVGAV
ncbi:putative secondary metabolism biosynthetic enzyme [Venturia effusa]|uniref:Putative secondary metabolism biosynthetic enzyme n=1 Tax=Venturia effusa TaxID=50376 RepID=A0A517LFE1_9PEZI|nr:putative secondary metabolism biosynthetic enzyme [Venturia effusa]